MNSTPRASQRRWVSHRLPGGGGGNTAAPGFHGKLVRVGRPGVKAGPFLFAWGGRYGWRGGRPSPPTAGFTPRRLKGKQTPRHPPPQPPGRFSRFDPSGRGGERCRSGGEAFQAVAQGVPVAAFEASFGSLAFPGFNQMLEAAGPFRGGFAALGAAFVALHPQLVFALARDFQVRKFVFNPSFHIIAQVSSRTAGINSVTLQPKSNWATIPVSMI